MTFFDKVRGRWELLGMGAFLCLCFPALIFLPEKMVQSTYHGDGSRAGGNEYAKLVDDYRKTILQACGAGFLLYTPYLTQRRTAASEATLLATQKSLDLARTTIEIARVMQITDRFTKAVNQLGATNSDGRG